MKTTSLIIEYLVAGILMIFAAMFLVNGYFPQDIQKLFVLFQNSKEYSLLYTIVFVAIAYAVGVILEPVARMIFEYSVNIFVSKWRLAKFLLKYRHELFESPLLAKYEVGSLNKLSERAKFAFQLSNAKSVMGMMRFYVLKESSELYKEIESQINRLRLLRVLVIVEIIVLAAIDVYKSIYSSSLWSFLFGVVVLVLLGSIVATIERSKRYYRAIERSYATLIFRQTSFKSQKRDSKKRSR